MKIKNQFFNKPTETKGLVTKGKSVTIPGQDFTPQEILRNFTQQRHLPEQIYTDIPVSDFQRMAIQDKIGYLRNLQKSNEEQKTQVNHRIKQLEQQQKIEAAKIAQQNLRKQIESEVKKRDDEKTK